MYMYFYNISNVYISSIYKTINTKIKIRFSKKKIKYFIIINLNAII